MKKELVDAEMAGTSPGVMQLWQLTLRYIAPVAIGAVFLMGIYDKFFS
jgi:NSS family neurotransmitter:Na+ symporter